MSGKVMGQVYDLELDHPEQSVLLSYADHADHDGNNVRPSIGLIAWKTGYSARQVQRIVAKLVKAGLMIVVEDRSEQGEPTLYRIDTTAGKTKKPYEGRGHMERERKKNSVKTSPPHDTTMSPPPCRNDVTPPMTSERHPGYDTQMSYKPSFNPSINPSIKPSDIAADAAPPQKLQPWPYTPEQDAQMVEAKEQADLETFRLSQKPANPSKKKTSKGRKAIQTEPEYVPPAAPPVAPEQAAAALAAFDDLESASGRELAPPTGMSKDAIERALTLATVPSGDRREVAALMGEIRRAGKEIRDDGICTADDIMARCVGKGSLFYTTYLAEDNDGGLTNPPTPMTIRKWIWSFETMRSKRFKSVRPPVDFEQQLVEAETRAARQRELNDTPSPFKPIIPAWQILSQPRKTA